MVMRAMKGIIVGALAGLACALIFAAILFVFAINTPQTEMGFGPSDAPYLAWAIVVIYGPPTTVLGAIIGGVWVWQRRRRRIKRGLCVKCGYDLRRRAIACPECGAMVR
jgi:hypothetical protein